jgi:hypothetical protein
MDYNRSARIVRKLIAKNGTKAVLRIPTGESVWNDDTASYIETYEEHQGVCLVTSYKQEDIDGSLVQAGDSRLLCVFPAEPKPDVSLVDVYRKTGELDATYNVVSCSPLKPDATVTILFKIQGRK